MKRYASRATKLFAIATLICGAVVLIGIIIAFAGVKNIGLPIGFILSGGFLGVIFFACFFAEKSRALIINTDKVIFPRGAEKNGQQFFKKTVVRISDIRSVESKFYKGDGIISGDCFFYTFKLKDGTSITVTLYEYGKEAEKEILETIKSSIE